MRFLSNKKTELILFSVLLFFTAAQIGSAATEIIDFESDAWTLSPGSKIVTYLEQKALRGGARLSEQEFSDGIIEYDVAFQGSRCFAGINFRVQTADNFEHFYIRPHKSNLADALQYTPVFNGLSSWQLYSGPGFTAAAPIAHKKWIHVKMEVKGSQARVFLNNSTRPALVMTDLKHGQSQGSLGLFAPANGLAHFANFSYQKNVSLEFPETPKKPSALGTLPDWELSQAFKVNNINMEKYPAEQTLDQIKWQAAAIDAQGMVDIARYVKKSGQIPDCVIARTSIVADKEDTRQFKFGYSDAITIFFNGKIVFYGNSTFRLRDPAFQGLIGLNDAVYLPLQPGRNELLVMVAETFGGWGFMFQDAEFIVQHADLEKLWELSFTLNYPESVVFDPKRNILYVSNFINDGSQFISQLTIDGAIKKLHWVTGLTQPTGLSIYQDKLYAVDRTGLNEIDIDSGEILAKYPIPGAQFSNDVDFDGEGNAYISDSRKNAIYKFSQGKFETWLQGKEIMAPNGLCVDGARILVGVSSEGSLKSVNLADKSIKTLVSLGPGAVMDGIKTAGEGNILFSDYNGRIFRLTRGGIKTELLNSTIPRQFCADFEYIPAQSLLIVPSLYDNRIRAYKVKKD